MAAAAVAQAQAAAVVAALEPLGRLPERQAPLTRVVAAVAATETAALVVAVS